MGGCQSIDGAEDIASYHRAAARVRHGRHPNVRNAGLPPVHGEPPPVLRKRTLSVDLAHEQLLARRVVRPIQPGSTSIAIQCRPDQPPSAQRMRVTSGGVPVAFFDAGRR